MCYNHKKDLHVLELRDLPLTLSGLTTQEGLSSWLT